MPHEQGSVDDDEAFHAAHRRPPRSRFGRPGAPGWPAVEALLPPIEGVDVVDLGCGSGAFARWCAARGAASVLGLDLSTRMLDRARAETDDARVHYEQSDLDQVTLRPASYDLAHSALTLHHLRDPLRFFRVVTAGLRPGGRLVLSFEHPVFTAPRVPAFVALPDGRRVWPLDAYADEGERLTDPPAPGGRRQHRMLGTTLTALARSGLRLRELVEWAPSPEAVDVDPDLSGDRDRPRFVLLSADQGWPAQA